MFSAMAIAVTLLCQPLPKISGFLSIDAKDSIISIAAFILGPISAVIISFLSALIEFLTFSTTGWYGFVMNFASSACFALVASLIYKKMRSYSGALIGYLFAIIATTSVMMALNLFITPLYFGMPRATVAELLPTLLLPFNLAKTLMNSAIAILLYKPIISSMRKARLMPASSDKSDKKPFFNILTLYTLIIGVAALSIAIVIFVMKA